MIMTIGKTNKGYKRMDCGRFEKDQFIYMDGCSKCTREYYKRYIKLLRRKDKI